ncbi:MAG: hypothetical protein ACI8V2_002069 [Candidatus Latescibacterota bacterium]
MFLIGLVNFKKCFMELLKLAEEAVSAGVEVEIREYAA